MHLFDQEVIARGKTSISVLSENSATITLNPNWSMICYDLVPCFTNFLNDFGVVSSWPNNGYTSGDFLKACEYLLISQIEFLHGTPY